MLALSAFPLSYSGSSIVKKFSVWKIEHSKKYTSSSDESNALAAFATNDRVIEEHNKQGLSYTLGHNAYSDLTWEEFKWQMLPGLAPKVHAGEMHVTPANEVLADSVDWVAAGAVTKVKNQARCGSCWAFSTTGSVEGGLFVNEKKLVSLSEEDLVQCDKNGDQGCQGGLMDNAFEWIEKNGICTEEDYPYTSGTGTTGTCQKGCTPAVTLSGFKDIKAKDEAGLKSAIAQQPVSVAIEADKSAFQLYKSGVLDSALCGKQLDHGVLAVGYGTDGGKDYYKVKNSWGATWGENGYVRMVQGKNMCGIASQASYPTGVKSAKASLHGVAVPKTGLAAANGHYNDPFDGCAADETPFKITGLDGEICSPSCTSGTCPTDVPAGVTAAPQCALADPQGNKYCVLVCTPSVQDDQCGDKATCKPIQGQGVCTYDSR